MSARARADSWHAGPSGHGGFAPAPDSDLARARDARRRGTKERGERSCACFIASRYITQYRQARVSQAEEDRRAMTAEERKAAMRARVAALRAEFEELSEWNAALPPAERFILYYIILYFHIILYYIILYYIFTFFSSRSGPSGTPPCRRP